MTSIFTKIMMGDIPSYKIYEDEWTYAFLDIAPVQPGHTLVVPKLEVDSYLDLPDPYYTKVFLTAKTIAPRLLKATGKKRVGTMILGFDVPHVHYHLIPINHASEFHNKGVNASQVDLQKTHTKILQAVES